MPKPGLWAKSMPCHEEEENREKEYAIEEYILVVIIYVKNNFCAVLFLH